MTAYREDNSGKLVRQENTLEQQLIGTGLTNASAKCMRVDWPINN